MKNIRIVLIAIIALFAALLSACGASEDDLQKAYDSGFNKGYEEGHAEGYDEGFSVGRDRGQQQGYTDGYNQGLDEGLRLHPDYVEYPDVTPELNAYLNRTKILD